VTTRPFVCIAVVQAGYTSVEVALRSLALNRSPSRKERTI
jgi:hypothetical protein